MVNLHQLWRIVADGIRNALPVYLLPPSSCAAPSSAGEAFRPAGLSRAGCAVVAGNPTTCPCLIAAQGFAIAVVTSKCTH